MFKGPLSAVFWGVLFGTFNGAVSRYALKKVLNSADRAFYSVFAAGFLWRLVFLAASVVARK